MTDVVEVVKLGILKPLAEIADTCFNPTDDTQGECADGDCYCTKTADKIARAALAALNEAGYVVERGWQPIETAPKDGTHILIFMADRPYGQYWTFMQRPPMVAHWFGPPDLPGLRAGGFYLSVHERDAQEKLHPTHWMPLPEPPETPRP